MQPASWTIAGRGNQGSARGHIREFDGLRGLAILAVMLHHFWPRSGPLAEWGRLPHLGWVGVDLFFVISGTLIAGILLETRADQRYYRNFYSRRALRIFPLYFIIVGGAFLVIPWLQANTHPGAFVRESGSAWWYLLYAGNIRESLTGAAPAYVLAPTWSLCIEEHFYLSFALLVAAMPPARLRVLLWMLLLFAPGLRFATALAWPDNERIQYLFTLSRVDVLALGCLLALGLRGLAWLPPPRATSWLLSAALLACAIAYHLGGLDRTTQFGRTLGYSLVAATAFLLVLWAIQRRGLLSTCWLRFGPLCTLGILCYGIYLLQRPAQVVLGKVAGRFWPGFEFDSVTGLVACCLVAVAAATASWLCIERPCLRLKRYFVSTRHPEAANPPSVPAETEPGTAALEAKPPDGQAERSIA